MTTLLLADGRDQPDLAAGELEVDPSTGDRLRPARVDPEHVRNLVASLSPMPQGGGSGGVAGGCPSEVKTYSDSDFSGGEFILQAGFVETEIAAAEFVVDEGDFPIMLNVTEIIFAQLNTTVGTTTEWSLLVWEGNPQTGILIEEFSSDNIILPHITMPPGTNGVNVQVSVDPADPDQIIIQANPSNSFTVGFRIDKHNNPPTSSCLCPCDPLPPGCGLGWTLPAVCCPPPTNSNAFPTTDATGMTNAGKNWLFARDCQGSQCAAAAGWYTFPQLGQYQPSGDWNIRVTYTPLSCEISFGGCCKASGGCEVMSNFDCAAEGGVYLGANSSCQGANCPFGACCLPQGACQIRSSTACAQEGGSYQGNNTNCADAGCPISVACCFGGTSGSCVELDSVEECTSFGGMVVGELCDDGGCELLVGACCVPSTGACVENFPIENCEIVEGNWQGMATTCADTICFPEGACCLPDGSCIGPVSPKECEDANGEFKGHESECATASCPQPMGACCLPNGACVPTIESDCPLVGGEWKGAGTNCADTSGSGQADACEEQKCPADLTGNGTVGVPDLLILLSSWGECADPGDCPGDLTGDGLVGVSDLLLMLSSWGDC